MSIKNANGLKTSEYPVHTAVRHIEGEISFEEANALLQTCYEKNPTCDAAGRTEEADKAPHGSPRCFLSVPSALHQTSISPFNAVILQNGDMDAAYIEILYDIREIYGKGRLLN